jgi:hypothetical protein
VFRKSSVRCKVLGASALTAALSLSLLGLAASPAAAAPTHDPVLGAGKVQADINGDGYADLITSTLLYDDDRSGALVVLFGSATGLRTTGQQRLNPATCRPPASMRS